MLNIISKEIQLEERNSTDLEKVFQESDYTQRNIEAFQYLRNRDYHSAKHAYKECVNFAKQNDDDYKFADSLTNYGITQFFCGKVIDAIESFESSQRISQKLSKNAKNADKKSSSLYMKTLSNLCLANLCLNKKNESLTHLQTLVDFLNSEKDIAFKQTLLKEILYIFFRTETLVNYIDVHHKYSFNLKEKVTVSDENKDSNEVHQCIVNRILFYFHKYLRENDLESWIKCLSEESENFKLIKDYNGFVFAVFNHYASLFLKDPETNATQSKVKITSLCKVLIGDKDRSEIKEKSAETILLEMKEKMVTSVEIYRKLYELEKTLLIDDSSFSDISGINLKIPASPSKVLVKLFLKHALNSLSELENNPNYDEKYIKQMRLQIILTLQLLEKNQIDCNSIQIHKIDPQISHSLNVLFDNLLWIKYKSTMKRYFKNFMYETLGYTSREDLRFIKDRKFEIFEKMNFQTIVNGNILTKINFNSSGKKEHFYQLDPKENAIKIFEKKTDRTFKYLYLKNVKKFSYAVSSENLRKKFKSIQNTQLNSPWLFFSIIKKDRSVDLYLEEPQLVNWFYGLRKQLKDNEMDCKLISVNKFLLTRMKLKLISRLKEEKENRQYKDIISGILQGNIYLKYINLSSYNLERGVQNFSFVKILLLYLKIKNIVI